MNKVVFSFILTAVLVGSRSTIVFGREKVPTDSFKKGKAVVINAVAGDFDNFPKWVTESVFYQIFPDRFYRSGKVSLGVDFEGWEVPPSYFRFKGGDLYGVIERLDYLVDLGVNAIYFNPIFSSTANHRYHTNDYFMVDPILGGNKAFDQLLKACHDRGVRIVLDGVFNHVGRGFYAFTHVAENQENSPFQSWFRINSFPIYPYDETRPANYDAWWGLRMLPKLNHSNPAVRDYIFRVAEYWIERGVDGWRLDVPNEIGDDNFWREFRTRIKSRNPNAYIVGEIWEDATRWLQGDQFDAVMNYPFMKAVLDFLLDPSNSYCGKRSSGFRDICRNISTADFLARLRDLSSHYLKPITLMQYNLLSSHDTVRFMSFMDGDLRKFQLGYALLFFFPGTPSIYYGDEIGMEGHKDPDCRRGMVWDQARWNAEARNLLKGLIRLRRGYPELQVGTFEAVQISGDLFYISRKTQTREVRLYVNNNRSNAVDFTPVGRRLYGPEGRRLNPLEFAIYLTE